MRERGEKAEHVNQPQSGDEPDAPSSASGSEADVLNVISQFEAQLESLKKVHTERRRSEKELLARQAAIAQREQELSLQTERLKQDLAVIEQERARLARWQDELRAAAEELDSRQKKIRSIESELERRSSELEQRAARIEEAAKALEQTRAETVERSSKLEQRAQQLEQAEARLAAQAERLAERVRQLERESTDALERAKADSQRAEAAEKAREKAESAVQRLHAELERVQQQAQALAEGLQARDAALADLTARAEQLASRREELEAELARSQELIDQANAQRAEIEAGAAERVQLLTEKLSAIESNSGKAEKEAEAQRARIAELEQEASKLRDKIDRLESARQGEAASVQSHIAQLTAELESTREELAGRERVIAELNKKLEFATEKLRELGELVRNQVTEDPRAAEALTKAMALNDQLQNRVRKLEERTKSLEQENRSLRDRASRAGGVGAAPRSDEALQLRRARLARVRLALREQTRKIRRANALLQERFDQCEQLLSRRAELAAAYEAIQRERARAERVKARSSTAGLVLAFVVTLAVLLGLSWIVAGQVHPGQFAATASIEASMGDRNLGAQELAEWQAYHEQLFEDPRFIETLAEAMQRRGLSTLATPGALSAYLAHALSVESPRDGKINFELRDEGAARTERVLDTIVVAVARAANRTRMRRADGATTVVTEPAAAKQEPLDSTRLTYAGMIFGGGFLLTSGFGAFVWRRMALAKKQFEHDQHLQALLAEARWSDPRYNIDGSGKNLESQEPEH
ncbi:MAG: hypothetical protein Kow0022_12740 [Phycisphaerales bacterium]